MLKRILLIVSLLLLISAAAWWNLTRQRNISEQSETLQRKTEYSLNVVSGKKYAVNDPKALSFAIRDQTGKTLASFDNTYEKPMHLIVVRKDRTQYQHLHPELDTTSGSFTIPDFRFPTDGEYRIIADFTPSTSLADADGVKAPVTHYQDVEVGDISRYAPISVGDEQTSDTDGEVELSLFAVPNDGGGEGYLAETINPVAMTVRKNGRDYADFENYLGARGHLTVLGPDLEFVRARPSIDSTEKTYIFGYNMQFPKKGMYRLFMQLDDQGTIRSFELTIPVK